MCAGSRRPDVARSTTEHLAFDDVNGGVDGSMWACAAGAWSLCCHEANVQKERQDIFCNLVVLLRWLLEC